jgi:putative transcriptional regulator
MTQSLVGNLLVASTLVDEPLFSRGVCLLVHHDESGAIGVMLNRPIMPPPQALMKILNPDADGSDTPPAESGGKSRLPAGGVGGPGEAIEVSAGEPLGSAPGMVHFGGPLSGPVVAVHSSLALAEVETGRGVYVAAQKDHLETLVRESRSAYRLIIGHAAWSVQQLTDELAAGFWHILPATPETVFPLHADLWPYLIRRATGASVAAWVGAPDTAGVTGLN